MGYQSDVFLNKLNYKGNFPLQHNLGNYGETTGLNNYNLALSPEVSELKKGMVLYIHFTNINTTASTLKINQTPSKNLVKYEANQKTPLVNGDIQPSKIYHTIYDGFDFVITEIIEDYEYNLGNPQKNGRSLQSTINGQRTWEEITKTLHTNYGTHGLTGTGEQTIGNTYSLPIGTFENKQSIQILVNGLVQGAGNKILLLKMAGITLLQQIITTTSQTPFSIRITCGRVNNNTLRGLAILELDDLPNKMTNIQLTIPNILTTQHLIELRGEVNAPTADITRYMFLIRHLV